MGDVHQLPDLVGREEQVVLDLLFGEPEIEQLGGVGVGE